MKDVRIDNRINRVFVLKETDERMVYIPIKSLHRVDYDRLRKIEADAGEGNMLDAMARLAVDNGINALVMYDSLIQVLVKTAEKAGDRILKPGEKRPAPPLVQVVHQPAPQIIYAQAPVVGEQVKQEQPKPRRKPGPKPKPKTE